MESKPKFSERIKKFYIKHEVEIACFAVGAATSAVYFTYMAFKAVQANEINLPLTLLYGDEATEELFKTDAKIWITFFKNNGRAITQYMSEVNTNEELLRRLQEAINR